MFQTEHLQEKWSPVLEHPDLPDIEDSYKRAVTTVILENQERALREDAAFLSESVPTGNVSGVGNWDPILISLVRRAMPNLIAYDICGVQPMTGPTGLIFAMRARHLSMDGEEALVDETTGAVANGFSGDFSNQNAGGTIGGGDIGASESNPAALNDSPTAGTYTFATGMTTAQGEALGDSSTNAFAEMSFSIDKSTVTAVSRALKAEYSMELAQDLKAIHGLDAATALANILSTEILAEINREVVRSIYKTAEKGAAINTTTAGIFDLDTDSNGRWSVEKFKGLMFSIERDANRIGQRTRRGKGNMVICSADVASALQMAGVLDYTPALNSNNLNVDDTSTTFAGTLNGRFKVYVDPYSANSAASQYYVVGYKGSSPYDAGFFYCPYVPLQMVRAVGENSFQPKIGFKTRYGMAANPFAVAGAEAAGTAATIALTANANAYYQRVKVTNLM